MKYKKGKFLSEKTLAVWSISSRHTLLPIIKQWCVQRALNKQLANVDSRINHSLKAVSDLRPSLSISRLQFLYPKWAILLLLGSLLALTFQNPTYSITYTMLRTNLIRLSVELSHTGFFKQPYNIHLWFISHLSQKQFKVYLKCINRNHFRLPQ